VKFQPQVWLIAAAAGPVPAAQPPHLQRGWPVLNAALISVAQKLEHYEIATYGCLRGWARLLGNTEAAGLLQQILVEEKAANHALSELARSRSNNEALGEAPCTNGSDAQPPIWQRGVRLASAGRSGFTTMASWTENAL
jgi:hypothetical protein